MGKNVYVVGVGLTKFVKPTTGDDYPDFAKKAVLDALEDARVRYSEIQQAICGYAIGDSSCGQRVLYQIGMTGIPIYNVNNNCATGSTALFLAKQLIEGGISDVVLAVGFEKMLPGPLTTNFPDRTSPTHKLKLKMIELAGLTSAPILAQYFGNAATEYMKKFHGITERHIAKIAVKNYRHGANNPRAQKSKEYTIEEVLNSRKVYGPLTKLECCLNSDGAGAAVLMSEKAVIKYGLKEKAVEIIGMEMVTDTEAVFSENSFMKLAGYDMTVLAAKKIYEKTGISPKQVDVVELYDNVASNEMITYEGLQLCREGEAGKFIDAGDNTYGGRVVVNPSGGLIARGHPIGATGLAQCAELVWQLRGEAGERQVPHARIALQHNQGGGGAVVVAIYRKGFTSALSNQVAAVTSKLEAFKFFKYVKFLEAAMESDTRMVDKLEGICLLVVTNGPDGAEGFCSIKVKEGKVEFTYDCKENPDIIFTISDDDLTDIITEKLNPQKAFFEGKIRIQGNIGLAIAFQMEISSKLAAIRSRL